MRAAAATSLTRDASADYEDEHDPPEGACEEKALAERAGQCQG